MPGSLPDKPSFTLQTQPVWTYWYHAHSRFQEQTGLFGPIIIERTSGERHAAIASTSCCSRTGRTLTRAQLRNAEAQKATTSTSAAKQSRTSSRRAHQRPRGDGGGSAHGGEMRMNPRPPRCVRPHLHVSHERRCPSGNWTGLFNRGERVRLRSSRLIDELLRVRIPDLKMTVVAADGRTSSRSRWTNSALARPKCWTSGRASDERAYTIFAQSMDRSAYARGTLAPRRGMAADVPSLDARVILTMTDMAWAMAGCTVRCRGWRRCPMAGMDHGPELQWSTATRRLWIMTV